MKLMDGALVQRRSHRAGYEAAFADEGIALICLLSNGIRGGC
jgi:hypothetical protein